MNKETYHNLYSCVVLIMTFTMIISSLRCTYQIVTVKPVTLQIKDSISLPQPVIPPDSNEYSGEERYWMGYVDGKTAAKERYFPGLGLEGCVVGVAGSCLSSIISTVCVGYAGIAPLLIIAPSGGMVTSGVRLFKEFKNPSIYVEYDSLVNIDSCYCKGFKAGLLKDTKFTRFASLGCGGFLGTGLVVTAIAVTYITLMGLSM